MGSWSLTRTSFNNVDAVCRLTHGSFDRIAELTGVPAPSFVDTYPQLMSEMKLSMLEYVKALRTKKNYPDLPFGIGNHQGKPKLVLEKTTDGYPILPAPLPSQTWNKQDWEDLFTMYMGWHYGKMQSIMEPHY